jgi:hypothetical protein
MFPFTDIEGSTRPLHTLGPDAEREPELAKTYTAGRQLHRWDAVAVASGEDDVAQTVP